MEGIERGQQCNRDGCTGVIQEHDREGGCSCHINPPCGYCTTPREFCPECGWDALEEYSEPQLSQEQIDYYKEEQERGEAEYQRFITLYQSSELVDKFEYRTKPHTNFSMVKYGMFPTSMSLEDILNKIRGTFGGRLNKLDKETGRFEYIAYTD